MEADDLYHAPGALPPNLLVVTSPQAYRGVGGWERWERFARREVGFRGLLTADARHMVLYSR